MSNLDFVRSLRSAWDRGDFSATTWAHPEIEYVIVDGAAPRRWKGLRGMANAWRDFLTDWEDWRAQATEFQELDSERVLVLVELSGRNRASGLEVGQIGSAQGANLFHVRDGKVAKFVLYLGKCVGSRRAPKPPALSQSTSVVDAGVIVASGPGEPPARRARPECGGWLARS